LQEGARIWKRQKMGFGYSMEGINCRSVKERRRFERNKEIKCGV
jgi:hypothetical protein